MGGKRKSSGGFEDISSYSKPKGLKNRLKYFWSLKVKTFFLKNQKRNLKAILSVFICLVLVVSALGGAYIRKMLSLINQNDGNFGNPDATFAAEEYDDDVSYNTIADIESANSIKELLKAWATNNGEKLHHKKVINVLLVGEDDEDGSHRSDSTMLVSVNTKTKKITITSFLRDSYTYMNINGKDRYDKTNHSYAWGGAAKLMEVISNNYKIQVDHYVSINYQSFVKAVDALGGVSVPVTKAEASFMNRTTKIKGFESGENVLLDGQHALVYARIRKLDSEVERTRRQRELISSVIRNVKASSISDINNAIETFLPYITTNYKTTEILSLASQALTEGWLQYEIVSTVQPSEEVRYGVDYFQTYSGRLFVWIVDYIKAARELQLALYGQTNIEINASTHISAIDLARGTVSSSSDNYYEDDYSEETDGEEYETHFYTEPESTTRRGIFSWLDNYGNNEETTEEETSGGYSDNGGTGYGDGSEYVGDYWEETSEEETTDFFDSPAFDPDDFGEQDLFESYYQ